MKKEIQDDLASPGPQEKKTTSSQLDEFRELKKKRKAQNLNFFKKVTRLGSGIKQDADEIREQRQLIALNVWLAQATTIIEGRSSVLEYLNTALQMQINIIQQCPYSNLTELTRVEDVNDHKRAMLIIQLIYLEQIRGLNPGQAEIDAKEHLSKITLDAGSYTYHLVHDETDSTAIDAHREEIQRIHQTSLQPLPTKIRLHDVFIDWICKTGLALEFVLSQYKKYLNKDKNPAYMTGDAFQFAMNVIHQSFNVLTVDVFRPYTQQRQHPIAKLILTYGFSMSHFPDFQFVIDAEIVDLCFDLGTRYPIYRREKRSQKLVNAISKTDSCTLKEFMSVFGELKKEETEKHQEALTEKSLSQYPLSTYRRISKEKSLPAIFITHKKKKKQAASQAPKTSFFKPAATDDIPPLQEAFDALGRNDFQRAIEIYISCAQKCRESSDTQQALSIGCLHLNALMLQFLYTAQNAQRKAQLIPGCLDACLTQGKMLLMEIEFMTESDKTQFISNYGVVLFTACQYYLLAGNKDQFEILFSEYSLYVKTWFPSSSTLQDAIVNQTQIILLRIDSDILHTKQFIDSHDDPHIRFKLICQHQPFWRTKFEECKTAAENLEKIVKGHPEPNNYDDLHKTLQFMMLHLSNIIEESIQNIIHYKETAEAYHAALMRYTNILIHSNRPKPARPAVKTLLTYRYLDTLAEMNGGREDLQNLETLRDEVNATKFGPVSREDETSHFGFAS